MLAAAVEPLTRDGARNAARDELSHRVYDEARPSLIMRFLAAVVRGIRELLERASSATPGGAFGLLALVLVIVVLVAVLLRLGPLRRVQSAAGALDVPGSVTAVGLRSQAEAFAGEGRWAEAVRARLRAIVRLLEERTLLEPRPGRTAREVAADAGAALPDLRPALERAASVFGEVWYGQRDATDDDYAEMVTLDEALQRRRPGFPPPAGDDTSRPQVPA